MGLLDAVRERLSRGSGDENDPTGSGESSGTRTPRREAPDVLVAYADRWEAVEGGMGSYVVYPPPDGPSSVRRCHTRSELRRRVEQWYGDESDADTGDAAATGTR